MGPTVVHGIFLYVSHIWSEFRESLGIFCGMLSIQHNVVMNLFRGFEMK